MIAFASQYPILRSGCALCNRASCAQWFALIGVTCTSLGIANAAGFDDMGAFNPARTNASSSLVVNDSRPKWLSVASTNAAVGVKAAATIDDADSSLRNEKNATALLRFSSVRISGRAPSFHAPRSARPIAKKPEHPA